MKRLLSFIVIAVFAVACGGDTNPALEQTQTPTVSESASPSPSLEPSPSETANESPTPAKTTRAPKRFTYDETINGKTLTLVPGDMVQVRISANASTGYHWETTTKPDSTIVRLSRDEYEAPKQQTPPIVGAPGHQVWEFTANGEGETNFSAANYPPGSSTAEDRFTLKFRVST